MITVTETLFQAVRRGARLSVRIEVGEGQIGGASLHWEGSDLEPTIEADGRRLVVLLPRDTFPSDPCNTLLKTVVTVKDVREETDRVSVTYHFGEDGDSEPVTVPGMADRDQGLVEFRVTFSFFCL